MLIKIIANQSVCFADVPGYGMLSRMPMRKKKRSSCKLRLMFISETVILNIPDIPKSPFKV